MVSVSAHECTWCGEPTELETDVCSEACAEASSLADAEREMWAEYEAGCRRELAAESARAMAYDAAQARWKGEEE